MSDWHTEKFLDYYKDNKRALKVLKNYGEIVAWSIRNVLIYGAEKGVADKVLEILENHWKTYLSKIPKKRRLKLNSKGRKETMLMLARICREVLKLPEDLPVLQPL